jgi:hypothetical protein
VKSLGLALLALLALGALLYFGIKARDRNALHQQASQSHQDPGSLPLATVRFKVGGEKMGFVKSPEVQRILLDEYHLQVQPEKAGSVEMVQDETNGYDAVWPASEYCKQIFEQRGRQTGLAGYKTADIFSSPLVIMSWPQVTDALIRRGIVRTQDGAYFIVDMPKLLKLIEDRARWRDVDSSVAMIYGSVNTKSTDPTKSNSGATLMGLYAGIMNGGDPPTLEQLDPLLKRLKSISDRGGMKEASSGDIFSHALSQGVGAYPLFAVYENQYLEAIVADQGRSDLRTQLRVLYPQPTVFASHPLITLTKNGQRLAEALADPKIQKIAWEQHGFRSATPGLVMDPQIFKAGGIPRQVMSVMPMPEANVMERLNQALLEQK